MTHHSCRRQRGLTDTPASLVKLIYNPSTMPKSLSAKFTLNDLRAARTTGQKIAMLTCYDFTTARLMQDAGVPALLVGDSAGNVILGHQSTIAVSLDFMIELTAAVVRGAPNALVVGDMPFGSYQASVSQGVRNVVRMLKLTGCDCIKLEVATSHAKLVSRLTDAGVAVMAHLGLRPQTVGLMGGYKFQGRTADQARVIVEAAVRMQEAGAAALLLEAVPPEVSQAVVANTAIPVIGCGAGPACHGSVVVTHDILGLSVARPRFAPLLQDVGMTLKNVYAQYVRQLGDGQYPAAEHQYEMPMQEKAKFQNQGQAQATSVAGAHRLKH
jgi:3-methyl-2-oxobutanoate hydroxymethyltransferase